MHREDKEDHGIQMEQPKGIDVTDLKCLHNVESSVAKTRTEWDLKFLGKEVQLCLMATRDRD